MTYEMIAKRDSETVRSRRASSIVAVLKARVWASEGWHVTITDDEGQSFELSEFDVLLGDVWSADRDRATAERLAAALRAN